MFGVPKQKVKVLLLDADFSGVLEDRDLSEGGIKYEDKLFHIGRHIPIRVIEKGFVTSKEYLLFILRHNSLTPAENINSPLSAVYPQFKENKMSPELFRKITGTKILANMIKTKKSSSTPFYLLIGLVIGLCAMYVLVGMNILTISSFT